MTTPFTESELERLHALRRAAAEINHSSVMREGADVGVSFSIRSGEGITATRQGYDPERFRSFMIALRRTYAQNDGANFLAALNVISRRIPALREALQDLRSRYLDVLRSRQVVINGLDHSEIFNAWLYGSVFHDDDPDLRKRWEDLSNDPVSGSMANMIVEATGLQLAHHVLLLDQYVADVLGEDALGPAPRHTSESAGGESASLRVAVRPHGQRGTLWIDFTNVGPVDARNITLEGFRPLNEGHEDVLVRGEAERKFPVPRLRSGERVSLMAAPTMGSPTEFEVVVAWDDPAGEHREEEFRLDLLAH